MSDEKLEEIYNFLAISDHLATAGQPTPEQLAAVGGAGYDLVVNLAMPDSSDALADEAQIVAAQGMEYIHIPVVWEAPTRAGRPQVKPYAESTPAD